MSFSKTSKLNLLQFLFKGIAMSPPTQVYLGLSSTVPLFDGSGVTEPSDPAYARQLTVFSEWEIDSLVDAPFLYNLLQIDFPLATEDWLAGDEIRYVIFFLAATGNGYYLYGELFQPKAVFNFDMFSFPATHLELEL